MKRIYIILAAAAAAITAITYISMQEAGMPPANDKIRVTASFFPLYYFAQAIGGDIADVRKFTPSGIEPHDYEPTPQDIARLENTDLLILNGIGLEPWAENIQDVLQSDPEVIRIGESVLNSGDPHVWLAPLLAKQEASLILEAFIKIDPANRDAYEANAAALNAKLDDLDQAFRDGLEVCAQRKIVTSHAAFGHLASAYGLEQVPISGISPDEEPSPQDLARIAEFARKEKIEYIFFEALVSPKLAETIAREIGAQTLILDPIEDGTDYFAQMYANLDNLRLALACQK